MTLCTHVPKLNQTQFTELGYAGIRGLALQEQLAQGHFLAAEQRSHGCDSGVRVLQWKNDLAAPRSSQISVTVTKN